MVNEFIHWLIDILIELIFEYELIIKMIKIESKYITNYILVNYKYIQIKNILID